MWSALNSFRSPLVVSITTGLLCSLVILAVHGAGLLQQVEINWYDWLLRSRPIPAARESRITFITISEDDIRRQGRWPITDETLALTLRRLLAHRPRAIGVDLYRDIEVPPGHDALTSLLLQEPRIIMVTQLGGGTVVRIPPPPVLEGGEQVGFNDVILDPDGLIRRALLSGRRRTSSLCLSSQARAALLEGGRYYPTTGSIRPRTAATGTDHVETIRPFGRRLCER